MKRNVLALGLIAGAMIVPAAGWADAGFGGAGTTSAYLIARTAERHSAYARASAAWEAVLSGRGHDAGGAEAAERAISNAVDAGDLPRAIALSKALAARGQASQIAAMALMADMAGRGEWGALSGALSDGMSVGPLVNGLAAGWAAMGAGRRTEAEAAFDAVASVPGLRTFGLMHKAYALGAAGDDAAAEGVWATGDDGGPLRLTRSSALARIAGLARTGRGDAAIAILDRLFDPAQDPEAAGLRAAILRGDPPAAAIADARAGIAETLLSVAAALKGEATDGYTLLYVRTASYLAPDHPGALMLQAELLGALGLHDEALAAWRAVPEGGGWIAARLGAAESLRALGREDEAIGLLGQLAATHVAASGVHLALGDALRAAGRLEEAIAAYDGAVAAAGPGAVPWRAFFARGIAHDRAGHWDAAKADLRRALRAAPDEPSLLSYLGDAMARRGEGLPEALRLVQTAAAARPENGRIAGSVGWVLHRMGLHARALAHLERAVSLLPGDPVVNEHLGDGYWAVGRQREARFQYRRALAFAADPAQAARIRAKLETGPQTAAQSEPGATARREETQAPAELAATIPD